MLDEGVIASDAMRIEYRIDIIDRNQTVLKIVRTSVLPHSTEHV